MVIYVPDTLTIDEIRLGDLPEGWKSTNPSICQKLGSQWYQHDERSAILKVPSIIVPQEHNYILNTTHPDFSKIKLIDQQAFIFDQRIKDPKLE